MAVRKRCVRCRKPLGDDNKCHNKSCVLCVDKDNVPVDNTGENDTKEVAKNE